MREPYPVLALDLDAAVRITGVSKGTIRSWRSAGIFRSSFELGPADEAGRYLYGFRDLLALRVLADARRELGVRSADLERVGRYLTDNRETPWSQLGVGAIGQRLITRNPATSEWDGDQAAPERELELGSVSEEVERAVGSAMGRSPAQIGRIERRRGVLGNRPVIAGTRIPIEAIREFADAGYSPQEIIDAYPRLETADIDAALAYESTAGVA